MSDVRRLVFAIIKFLKAQLSDGGLSGECAEGVEVGIQCLEAAYNIGASESSLDVPCGLQEIFKKYLIEYQETEKEATPEDKAQAVILKNEGNTHMSNQNFREAVACYTKAIKLDTKNAVYYCNRAAALNKLANYDSAIQDCKTALKYDPSYSKAYGRLGLAYASLNQHQEAVNNYRKALELEPENESYKTNLRLAEEALANAPANAFTAAAASPLGAAGAPFPNVDLSMIFTNPSLLNMANQMLSNPSMQNVMSNILSGQEGGGIEVLLQASQQLAQQMENDNPALVEQLRRYMGNSGEQGGAGDASSSQPKKPES